MKHLKIIALFVLVCMMLCACSTRDSLITVEVQSTPVLAGDMTEYPFTIAARNNDAFQSVNGATIREPFRQGESMHRLYVFPVDESMMSGIDGRTAWSTFRSQNPSVRVGFRIYFKVKGQGYDCVVLKPLRNDTSLALWQYFEFYLYDDIHNADTVLTVTNWQEDSFATSICLVPGPKASAVTNVTVTAFLYTSDKNFDRDGNYKGVNLHKVVIEKE